MVKLYYIIIYYNIMSNDAEELLADLKLFIKKPITNNNLTMKDILYDFENIKKKYCQKNICNIDNATKIKFQEFYNYCMSELKKHKKTSTKGGKKTSRHYKKKTRTQKKQKRQKGGENENIGGLIFGCLFLTVFYIVCNELGIQITEEEFLWWMSDLVYNE